MDSEMRNSELKDEVSQEGLRRTRIERILLKKTKLFYEQKREEVEFKRDFWARVNKVWQEVDNQANSAMDPQKRIKMLEEIHNEKQLMKTRITNIIGMKGVHREWRAMMEASFNRFKTKCSQLMNDRVKVPPFAEPGTTSPPKVSDIEGENELKDKVVKDGIRERAKRSHDQNKKSMDYIEPIPELCYRYLMVTEYPKSIFKDNRKVVPDLWYRYLMMMQEQESRIYLAYSAMDPQERDEKLEKFRIEWEKFLHFHFKKMQKMKMHPRAVKDIHKWRIEMEAGLNTFNKILKVQPFAEPGTTFVVKEPNEGEKQKKMETKKHKIKKHKVPHIESPYEEQVMKERLMQKRSMKPPVDEKLLKERLLKVLRKEKQMLKKIINFGRQSEQVKERRLKKMIKFGREKNLIEKALTIKPPITLVAKVPDEGGLTLAFDFKISRVPETETILTTSESTTYMSELTEEQLMTSFGTGSHFRFEVCKAVPRYNIDLEVYNISGYDKLMLFGIFKAEEHIPAPSPHYPYNLVKVSDPPFDNFDDSVFTSQSLPPELLQYGIFKAQNRISEPSHFYPSHMVNVPYPPLYTSTSSFYMFNRNFGDSLVLICDSSAPKELCHFTTEVFDSLKLTCHLFAIAYTERLNFKNLPQYTRYRQAQPKIKWPYPKIGQELFYFENDVLEICDDQQDISFSDFFAKKPNGGFTSCKLKGKDGYLELYYAALKYAVDATLEVEFFASCKETRVVGSAMVYYGKGFDYGHAPAETMIFETPDRGILPGKINLMRSVVAVPAQFSIIIVAKLYDFVSHNVVLSGAYEFRVPLHEPNSVGCIKGSEEGCLLGLKVHWKLPN